MTTQPPPAALTMAEPGQLAPKYQLAADELIGDLLADIDPDIGNLIHMRVAAGIKALDQRAESASDKAGWIAAHALPSWLTGLFWIQFDDGSVGREPATRDNGAWWYGRGKDREHAPVIAYCPALPPPPTSEK